MGDNREMKLKRYRGERKKGCGRRRQKKDQTTLAGPECVVVSSSDLKPPWGFDWPGCIGFRHGHATTTGGSAI